MEIIQNANDKHDWLNMFRLGEGAHGCAWARYRSPNMKNPASSAFPQIQLVATEIRPTNVMECSRETVSTFLSHAYGQICIS